MMVSDTEAYERSQLEPEHTSRLRAIELVLARLLAERVVMAPNPPSFLTSLREAVVSELRESTLSEASANLTLEAFDRLLTEAIGRLTR